MKYKYTQTCKNTTKKKKNYRDTQIINIESYTKNKIKKKFLYRPFLQTYNGHTDGVLCIKTHTRHPSLFFSGSCDGQIKFWLISQKKFIKSIQAHDKCIRDIAIDYSGSMLLSCSDDFTIKLWNIDKESKAKFCLQTNKTINSLSTHPSTYFFITGGNEVLLWDLGKFQPIQKLISGLSSISKIEFNPFEFNLISSCSSDSSIILFDFRLHIPINKIFLQMPSNDISWNHINSLQFTVANEDGNLYTFDLRNIEKVFKTHKGHVMPVLCLDQNRYDETIISGSYDNTIRIFKQNENLSSEILFTQRMRRVLDLSFSLDGKYIISASDDGDIRLWKSFDEKNYLFESNYQCQNNKKNFKKTKTFCKIKPNPKHLKSILFIKKKTCRNEKLNQHNRNLPPYIKFKKKKYFLTKLYKFVFKCYHLIN